MLRVPKDSLPDNCTGKSGCVPEGVPNHPWTYLLTDVLTYLVTVSLTLKTSDLKVLLYEIESFFSFFTDFDSYPYES